MCETDMFRSTACCHRWLALRARCRPDRDLTNCCQYQHNTVNWVDRLPPHRVMLVARLCPQCKTRGQYPREIYLMVTAVRSGVKFGSGPSRLDSGCDCFCCAM